MTLVSYLGRRASQAVLTVWAAYSLTFLLLNALPGDAISNRAKDPTARLSAADAAALKEHYGIDQPLWEQYFRSLGNALRGDLGQSLQSGDSVTGLIGHALPKTLALTAVALAFALVFTTTIGIACNYARPRWLRATVRSVPAALGSIPTFAIGVLLLQILSFRLHLVPAIDDDSFVALIAPGLTLGLMVSVTLSQVFATSIEQTLQEDFVEVAHARGLSGGYIFRRSILRNSSLPVLTLLGLAVGELIAGTVVTELVFARSGIGGTLLTAVNTQDVAVVQAVVLVSTVGYVLVNLLVDVLYPLLDPRVLTSRRPASDVPAAVGDEERIRAGV